MNKTVVSAAIAALFVVGAPVAYAAEPGDCGAATAALTTAQSELRDAVDADEKAQKAKDADRDFDRADRELRQAQNRLDRAKAAIADLGDDPLHPEPADGTPAEQRELKSAQDAVDDATKERDRARKQADKENTTELQRKADRTDADALKREVDDAQDDVNRLCGGVTTTPAPEPPAVDLDCGDFPLTDGRTAQQVLDSTPNADPNGLDSDGDRVACEPGQDTASDEADGGNGVGSVATPSGGVATGVGPE
jgi:hypothetical protein